MNPKSLTKGYLQKSEDSNPTNTWPNYAMVIHP